jgi:hypothetical protein
MSKIGMNALVITHEGRRLGLCGSWGAYAAQDSGTYPQGAEVHDTRTGELLATVWHGLLWLRGHRALNCQGARCLLPSAYVGGPRDDR